MPSEDEDEMAHSKHTSPQSMRAEKINASSILQGMQELIGNKKSPSVESLCYFPRETISLAEMKPSDDSSTISNANSRATKSIETTSYLLCNRVGVYKSIPDEVFPAGFITLAT
ncbi:hypothetical protein A4A49_01530 [Nicotiana attenuata]|uniref:Uncharacterized protein n=1 Tax=Nicotiana attenuata TaxID=49451 RepID=A0A314L7P6_NICAT|nr:hypothetical protein A4A49_01530 [Nicotiana attenuata]